MHRFTTEYRDCLGVTMGSNNHSQPLSPTCRFPPHSRLCHVRLPYPPTLPSPPPHEDPDITSPFTLKKSRLHYTAPTTPEDIAAKRKEAFERFTSAASPGNDWISKGEKWENRYINSAEVLCRGCQKKLVVHAHQSGALGSHASGKK